MQLKFGEDRIWKCPRTLSMRCDWNLAKTKFGIDLEYVCKIEVGLRKFLSGKKRDLDLESFCPGGKRERGSWT